MDVAASEFYGSADKAYDLNFKEEVNCVSRHSQSLQLYEILFIYDYHIILDIYSSCCVYVVYIFYCSACAEK